LAWKYSVGGSTVLLAEKNAVLIGGAEIDIDAPHPVALATLHAPSHRRTGADAPSNVASKMDDASTA
jgi:hypothetical protein